MRKAKTEEHLIKAFSELMLKKLLTPKNRNKGDWKLIPVSDLLFKLLDEYNELVEAVYKKEDAEEIVSECTDVANFAAMIADVVKGLT